MASVALVMIYYNLFLSDWGAFLHHDWPDSTPLHDWQTYVCHLWSCFWTPPPSHLLVDSMLPQSESRSLPLSLPPLSCLAPLPRMLLQDQKKNYKAVQSCEEGGSGGAYLEPLVALAQNGANMHNVLGPACIFLRKGFAESRQAVRKSRQYHVHACQEISTRFRTCTITETCGECA